jgi:hypothetical protein
MAEKASVSVPVIVGAIAILMLFVGVIAYNSLRSHEPVPVKTQSSDWLEKIARESGGDYNKLSAEDKAKVDKIPFGGREWLKRKYDSLH